jgi:hypothetical protein
VTRARVEEVVADVAEARRAAVQAEAHLASAAADGVDHESAYGLCYQAVLKGCIAVLLADGRRVTGGAGAHIVILTEATRRLGLAPDLADRLDAMRRARHRVFYDATEVSSLELEGARADAHALLGAALARLGAP